MTLTSTDVRVQYDGDDSTTVFPVTFSFWGLDDLEVVLQDANGNETDWTRGTQYALTGGDGSTGTLTVETTPTDYTPASGETLTIKSALANTQPTDIPIGGPFNTVTLEQQLDQIVRQGQQRDETLNRTLLFPLSDGSTLSSEIPNSANRANKYLTFDPAGEATATDAATASGTSVTATGSTTAILLADRAAFEVNLLNHGGVGDDATNNNAAFAAAESDRASRSFQKTVVPDGVFLVTTAPDWDKITGWGFVKYDSTSIPAGDIHSDVTVNVPSAFATIQDAWTYLLARRIFSNATFTIQMADDTYSFANQIFLNHPDGARVKLLGNTTTPANCVLRFTHSGAQEGLIVNTGYALGFLDGFKIDMASKATWPNNGSGLLSDTNGTVICGENMLIENFYYGAHARFGGHARVNKIQVDDAGDVGIFAFLGGTMSAIEGESYDADDATNNLGHGAVAEFGGVLNIPGGVSTGNRIGGLAMFNDGSMRTVDAVLTTTGEEDRVVSSDEFVSMRSGSAVVDIFVAGKGAGSYVKIGSGYTVDVGATVAGYLQVKDSSGNVRKVMIAS